MISLKVKLLSYYDYFYSTAYQISIILVPLQVFLSPAVPILVIYNGVRNFIENRITIT